MASRWAAGQPEPESTGTLLVRPKIPWLRYGVFGLFMTVLMLALVFAYPLLGRMHLVRYSGPGDTTVVIVLALAFLAFLAVGGFRLLLISRFSALRVEEGGLMLGTAIGIKHRFGQGDLARIARGSFDVTIRGSYIVSYFLFLDHEGRSLFKLSVKWWPQEGIEAIARALGLPFEASAEVLSGPAFRHAFPGSISWVVAHPRIASGLIGLTICAGFFAVLILLSIAGILTG